ncbi:thrombospondin type 3 repeat-containing protein [Micromonospora chokoriensis]
MSSYRDPAARGDVFPSEEELDPTGTGIEQASAPPAGRLPSHPAPTPGPRPTPAPASAPTRVPAPGPPPRAPGAQSIVTRHLDGSVEVVTDLDGDGIADVVQIDVDGDGIPDITYVDSDRDGRLDTVLGDPNAIGSGAHRA